MLNPNDSNTLPHITTHNGMCVLVVPLNNSIVVGKVFFSSGFWQPKMLFSKSVGIFGVRRIYVKHVCGRRLVNSFPLNISRFEMRGGVPVSMEKVCHFCGINTHKCLVLCLPEKAKFHMNE